MAEGKRPRVRPLQEIAPRVEVLKETRSYVLLSMWPWHGIVEPFYLVYGGGSPAKTKQNYKEAIRDALEKMVKGELSGPVAVGRFSGDHVFFKKDFYGNLLGPFFETGSLFHGVVLRRAAGYLFVDYIANDPDVETEQHLYPQPKIFFKSHGELGEAVAVAVQAPGTYESTVYLLRREMYEEPKTSEEVEALADRIAGTFVEMMDKELLRYALKTMEALQAPAWV